MLWTGVLPVRAVAFQILFLVVAIAIEAMILRSRLYLTRKQSMQYAVVVNLLTTISGWMVFFIIEPWLPETWRSYIMGYVFFGVKSIPPTLIMAGFGMFIITFWLKVQGLDWFDWIMGVGPELVPIAERSKFKGRKRQYKPFAAMPSRSIAVLWANACSFSAISMLLALRLLVVFR
jgi:hypothetical protein